MKNQILLVITFVIFFIACNSSTPVMNVDNIYAWCIVPFDIKKRSPQDRIEMLKRLGIKKYAYDWRIEHLKDMAHEFKLAQENQIEVIAVWIWIDAEWDTVGALSESNEKVFEILTDLQMKTQLWLGFNANYFENLSDEQAVMKGANMVKYLSERANAFGSKVALYNHGDWFGEPENQIKILNALPDLKIGLIYNFHHAHTQIDNYPHIVEIMTPYLWAVSLNGMRKEGPQIIPIGQGDIEEGMIQLLLDKGYSGPFGILGHVETEDVEMILKENLKGLFSLKLTTPNHSSI